MNDLASRLTTDGRFIVEEVDGRAFWPGQPFIADCAISSSCRPPGSVKDYAEALVHRYNSFIITRNTLRELANLITPPKSGPLREAWEKARAIAG